LIDSLTFHNQTLASLVPDGDYRAGDLARIEAALHDHGTLRFSRLASGLFSASSAGEAIAGSGYANVWVRDNVYVAFAHQVIGDIAVAAGVARALIAFFGLSRHRFLDVISGTADPEDVSRRPHVRFDGSRLSELSEEWAHAQNDALGYFLWLYSRLALTGKVPLEADAVATLALFPRYFEALRFWQDEDSGHWEEARKVSASSIGTVVAGLEAFLTLQRSAEHAGWPEGLARLTGGLVERGRLALDDILPQECAQISPARNRRYDAALVFLLFPLEVVASEAMVDLLLHDVSRFLTDDHGIRRYLGDSYWAPDYDTRLSPADRTRDFSSDVAARDALLAHIGDEAQWSLFDPMLSAYWGHRFLKTGSVSDRDRQILHLNRSLAQISDAWNCPELYYLQNGRYVPNPHAPLQWTQANLLVALHVMRRSLGHSHA
jgi:Glycosyl hydrolases family 15